jgi:hypothetical protein
MSLTRDAFHPKQQSPNICASTIRDMSESIEWYQRNQQVDFVSMRIRIRNTTCEAKLILLERLFRSGQELTRSLM